MFLCLPALIERFIENVVDVLIGQGLKVLQARVLDDLLFGRALAVVKCVFPCRLLFIQLAVLLLTLLFQLRVAILADVRDLVAEQLEGRLLLALADAIRQRLRKVIDRRQVPLVLDLPAIILKQHVLVERLPHTVDEGALVAIRVHVPRPIHCRVTALFLRVGVVHQIGIGDALGFEPVGHERFRGARQQLAAVGPVGIVRLPFDLVHVLGALQELGPHAERFEHRLGDLGAGLRRVAVLVLVEPCVAELGDHRGPAADLLGTLREQRLEVRVDAVNLVQRAAHAGAVHVLAVLRRQLRDRHREVGHVLVADQDVAGVGVYRDGILQPFLHLAGDLLPVGDGLVLQEVLQRIHQHLAIHTGRSAHPELDGMVHLVRQRAIAMLVDDVDDRDVVHGAARSRQRSDRIAAALDALDSLLQLVRADERVVIAEERRRAPGDKALPQTAHGQMQLVAERQVFRVHPEHLRHVVQRVVDHVDVVDQPLPGRAGVGAHRDAREAELFQRRCRHVVGRVLRVLIEARLAVELRNADLRTMRDGLRLVGAGLYPFIALEFFLRIAGQQGAGVAVGALRLAQRRAAGGAVRIPQVRILLLRLGTPCVTVGPAPVEHALAGLGQLEAGPAVGRVRGLVVPVDLRVVGAGVARLGAAGEQPVAGLPDHGADRAGAIH